jgi:4-hydroxy-2-oxoheptanedioate aldolase
MARVNRCIELLEQGQPIYYTGVEELSFESGRALAGTWADFLSLDFEHRPLDVIGLSAFMDGLRAAGPTRSGHPTPTVIATTAISGITPEEVYVNAWQIRHLLTAGVHGLLMVHARDPGAVRAFVGCCRYPMAQAGVGSGLGEGRRGSAGQNHPAEVWDMPPEEYVMKADVWPLNPDGELMLGLKLEDRHCLPTAAISTAVPGLAFAEWGPGDMGMSLGYASRHDPPYPPEMDAARDTIKGACDSAGIPFLCGWNDESMNAAERAAHVINVIGAKIIPCGPPGEELAVAGRALTGRTMPV